MVRILQAVPIAGDGITSRWHFPGEVLELSRELSAALIRDGLAEDADLPAAEQPKVLAKPSGKKEYRPSK